MRMARAVLPHMRGAGRGRIVNICSVVSFLPAPYMGVYAATKHALQGFSVSLDHEVRGSGLRSLAVRPGFTRTAIGANTTFVEHLNADTQRVRNAVEASLAKADDPKGVAEHILHLLARRNPPSISDVGKEARALRRLSSLLPARMFDAAFRRQFGLV